ncbi:Uncharacterized protein APZ42_002151 [Daphnia magna]|uniref:Uncharacterized protein n=1 Tax=Daphnia magna TaxID=35525 RepID=A0A164IGX8_9CRUS|nr:Uncharacterized protein APZ42_002151 [Daphnia magna]
MSWSSTVFGVLLSWSSTVAIPEKKTVRKFGFYPRLHTPITLFSGPFSTISPQFLPITCNNFEDCSNLL